MPEPDFARMRQIADEARKLERSDGTLSLADYERLSHAAREAAGGDDDLLDFIEAMQPAQHA